MNENLVAPNVAIEIRSGGRNEDRAQHFSTPTRSVFVLADGGVGGSAVAAEIVLQEVQSLFLHRHKSARDVLVGASKRLGGIATLQQGYSVTMLRLSMAILRQSKHTVPIAAYA